MGLNALENGWMKFTNVRVPAEYILWGEGKGLKLARMTLNTGRLTIPAGVTGSAKVLLKWVRDWANERVQWGQPVGRHDAVAQKIARMAANIFALESVALQTAGLYESGADIRLEAAIAKLWNTEVAWHMVDDALQVRGGRGYETADSLRARGEAPIPIERIMRDSRINLIFEGSSEIMKLFIAREAVDMHFALAFPIVSPKSTMGQRLSAAMKAAPFYLSWYPKTWLPDFRSYDEFGDLARHVRYVARTTRRLGRALFHAMVRFGPGLEKRQMVLFRAVDIGAELYAMSAACSRANLLATKYGQAEAVEMAEVFCLEARARIDDLFRDLHGPNDTAMYELAKQVLDGKHAWLERDLGATAATS